ncbi:enoyl-CoA hydratase/isomerase family protein [Mycobacterium malmoense]|uniref:Enoyl-CoA hydratase n=1 Tax=Mycobacterium malmoense TaxID=1780 RepID=A0ABX3SM72_MYCMA|nr:enoyl-CoA hydratase [Mycobacterium malmoense]ORA78988.1 enoyl-CoA hydratase [Mycobacterium malmoense]QZA17254.1 enoyl-CoA hydratase/isomerase family protein [Mycobacterium malmoense]UNB94044.1 enoyl-CoA hydratase/isomerase family protein [Mycobacterium malmoense]
MESRFVRLGRDGGVVTIELVNSKPLNILGAGAIEELTTAFRSVSQDDDVRVVVLRGAGEKAFIGGADINEMVGLDRASGEAFIRRLAGLCEAIRECPVPVIARLAGWCLGGGLEAAMSCDLRIAESGAKFGMPEVAVGIPSVIHSALMPALIGASHAAWLLLTGETIDANTAATWGLVHEVVAADALDIRIGELAAKLGGFGPHAVRQQKRLLNKWFDMTVHGAIEDSIEQFGLAFLTGEPQQHMRAFLSRGKDKR